MYTIEEKKIKWEETTKDKTRLLIYPTTNLYIFIVI